MRRCPFQQLRYVGVNLLFSFFAADSWSGAERRLASAHRLQPQLRTAAPSRVVPEPVSIAYAGDAFVLTDAASIVVDARDAEVSRIAEQLASLLRPSTGFVDSDLEQRRVGSWRDRACAFRRRSARP